MMNRHSIGSVSSYLLAAVLAAGAATAGLGQQSGPMTPPPPPVSAPPLRPSKPEPPPMPPEQIIQRFAANEAKMLDSIAGYRFQKTLHLEEIGPDGKPAGQVEIVWQQIAGPDGKLYEKVIHRTVSTLRSMQIEPGDLDKLFSAPMFPLIPSQLSKYDIAYEGKQPLDELQTYIFSVKPRELDRTHAYFSGVVWVDEGDFVIVKTIGKWVTELGDVKSPQLPFSLFETYREEVGKNLWFPTYSRSDENVPVGNITVPMRLIYRWTGYTPGSPSGLEQTPSAAPHPQEKP
jgi:hypothetical protein